MRAVQQEAMALLGIEPADIEPHPLSYFVRRTRSQQEAQILYDKHCEKRKMLLDQLGKKKEELVARARQLAEDFQTSARLNGEVIHEQHVINLNNKQAAEMERQNAQILRRMAIQQIRDIFHMRKSQAVTVRVDGLTDAHREKVAAMRKAAQDAVDSRTFAPKVREYPVKPVQNIEEHVERARLLREQQKQTLAEESDRLRAQVEKAHENSEKLLVEKVAKAEKKLVDTERRLSVLPARAAERQQQLLERGRERDAAYETKKVKIQENETQRIGKIKEELAVKDEQAQVVLVRNSEELKVRLAKEREILDRRNQAAEKIFQGIKDQKEEKKIQLARLQERADERLIELERTKRQKVFERGIADAEKLEAVRRVARGREAEVLKKRREQAEFANGMFMNLQNERAASLAAKAKAQETFAERRDRIGDIQRVMENMSDEQMVGALMVMLGVSDAEAREIVASAHQQRGAHERYC